MSRFVYWLLLMCFSLVFGCRIYRSAPETELLNMEITPGVGLRGQVEIGMSLKEIRGAKMWAQERETGEKHFVIPDRGINFTALDNIIRSVTFAFTPDRPASNFEGRADRLIRIPFHGRIVGFTNQVEDLKVYDVVSVFGSPPKVDWNWHHPLGLKLFWYGVPSKTYLSCAGELWFLHYPQAGITFNHDRDRPGHIDSVTVKRATGMADCILWQGKIRLNIMNESNPIIDFGPLRDITKLYLFTLYNDTDERIFLRQQQAYSSGLLYAYCSPFLDPGESTYLILKVFDNESKWLEMPVIVILDDGEERTITVKMWKVECDLNSTKVGESTSSENLLCHQSEDIDGKVAK